MLSVLEPDSTLSVATAVSDTQRRVTTLMMKTKANRMHDKMTPKSCVGMPTPIVKMNANNTKQTKIWRSQISAF